MGTLRKIKDWPVSQSFLSYSGSVRAFLAGMVAVGLTSLIVGLQTDVSTSDWSQNLGFMTNIWAGFTGFLVGVPVALVVLEMITGQRQDKVATKRVQDISVIAWNQFRDAVYELCSEERQNAMDEHAKIVKTIHDQVVVGFKNYSTDTDRSEASFRDMMEFLEHKRRLWAEALTRMARKVGQSHELQWMWIGIVRDWNTLDQYVRLQRLEQRLPWLERRYDSLIQQRMVRESHPMREFFSAHEGPSPENNSWTNASMLAAYRSIEDLTNGFIANHEQLKAAFDKREGYFPLTGIEGYFDAIERSQYELRSLRYIVENIDREAGWPWNFGQPESRK